MEQKYRVYTNQECPDDSSIEKIDVTEKDRQVLRTLATRFAEIASGEDMAIRKREWKALRDLKPERPMILFETFSVSGFVTDEDLKCDHPILRNVEKSMLYPIKQYDELKDDIVLEKYLRLAWQIHRSNYGVDIVEKQADNSMAYMSNFPIQTPDDLKKLKKRDFSVDREKTLYLKSVLEEIFGDLLPVHVGNYDNFFRDLGFNPFVGLNTTVFTMDLFKLIGNENLLSWPFEHPEALTEILEFLMDDRRRFLKWLKDETILTLNSDNQHAGPSGYGYVSELPDLNSDIEVDYKDCWCWVESQETNLFSPKMFDEWFLPYLADYANYFGLVSYGCCEPVYDRIEFVKKAIPKLRTVSISAWNNFEKAAEILGKEYVFCSKPNPAFISGEKPFWESAKKDIEHIFACTRNQPVEFIYRDVYDVGGDMSRLSKWVQMVKEVIGL